MKAKRTRAAEDDPVEEFQTALQPLYEKAAASVRAKALQACREAHSKAAPILQAWSDALFEGGELTDSGTGDVWRVRLQRDDKTLIAEQVNLAEYNWERWVCQITMAADDTKPVVRVLDDPDAVFAVCIFLELDPLPEYDELLWRHLYDGLLHRLLEYVYTVHHCMEALDESTRYFLPRKSISNQTVRNKGFTQSMHNFPADKRLAGRLEWAKRFHQEVELAKTLANQ